MVTIIAFGKLRLWSKIQEVRYWETVRVGPRHGLGDVMDQAGKLAGKEEIPKSCRGEKIWKQVQPKPQDL